MKKTLDDFVKVAKRKPDDIKSEDIAKEKQMMTKKKKTKEAEVDTKMNEVSVIKSPSNSFFKDVDEFTNLLSTWKEPLKDYITSIKMKKIFAFLSTEYSSLIIYPPKGLIFNAFDKTEWDNLKVVILGQDPYPSPGEAMGLSFSVPRGIKVPASLVNIYKCLAKDKKINFIKPNHGDLSKWSQQGVFLLNATLTVVHKSPNSHQKTSGWADFTDFVIKTINEKKSGVVFLLWGKFAIDKKKFIDPTKHHIIENIHPSPLAQSKGDFTSSEQFSRVNEILKNNKQEEIDWNL